MQRIFKIRKTSNQSVLTNPLLGYSVRTSECSTCSLNDRPECICLRSQRRHCVPDRAPRQEAPILRTPPPLPQERGLWMNACSAEALKWRLHPHPVFMFNVLNEHLPCPASRLLQLSKNWNCWDIFCFVSGVVLVFGKASAGQISQRKHCMHH